MEPLFHISNVCKELNITPRTLRYYEEEGLINSNRNSTKSTRHYTMKEIQKVKELLLLRGYGFNMREIKELYEKDINLPLALKEQENKIKNRLKVNNTKLHNIEKAITFLKEDIDIFYIDAKNDHEYFRKEEVKQEKKNQEKMNQEKMNQERIALLSTEGIGKLNFHFFFHSLSKAAKAVFVPLVNFDVLWKDIYKIFGAFKGITGVEVNGDEVSVYMKLEKREEPFTTKYIFHGTFIVSVQIDGLTFDSRC